MTAGSALPWRCQERVNAGEVKWKALKIRPQRENEPLSALCACRGGVFSKNHGKDFCLCKKICVNPPSITPQAGFLATQGKRRLRSRFLTAMSKTAVHGARTPYYGDAHIAPFTPAPAVLNLSLATSAGECAEAILLLSPRRGRMCASCRQPRCGFGACPNLRNCHLFGNFLTERGVLPA